MSISGNGRRRILEYRELETPKDKGPDVSATGEWDIQVLEVSAVGAELHWRYVLIWESPFPPDLKDDDGQG